MTSLFYVDGDNAPATLNVDMRAERLAAAEPIAACTGSKGAAAETLGARERPAYAVCGGAGAASGSRAPLTRDVPALRSYLNGFVPPGVQS